MLSISTINELGFATREDGYLTICAESDHSHLILQEMEPLELVQKIIVRNISPVKIKTGATYRLEFSPDIVYVIWGEAQDKKEAVFDEIAFVRTINIRFVYDLVLSRKAKTS